MCSVLEQYVQSSERGLEILKIIKNSSIHLQNLIEDSLDLSRI
jgi:signal transduction histidine kinase